MDMDSKELHKMTILMERVQQDIAEMKREQKDQGKRLQENSERIAALLADNDTDGRERAEIRKQMSAVIDKAHEAKHTSKLALFGAGSGGLAIIAQIIEVIRGSTP